MLAYPPSIQRVCRCILGGMTQTTLWHTETKQNLIPPYHPRICVCESIHSGGSGIAIARLSRKDVEMTENMVRRNVETSDKNAGDSMVKGYVQALLALDRAATALGLSSVDLLLAQWRDEPVSIPEETIYRSEIYNNLMDDFVREQVYCKVWKAIAENNLTDQVVEFFVSHDTSELIILTNTHDLPYSIFGSIVEEHFMNIQKYTDEEKYRNHIYE